MKCHAAKQNSCIGSENISFKKSYSPCKVVLLNDCVFVCVCVLHHLIITFQMEDWMTSAPGNKTVLSSEEKSKWEGRPSPKNMLRSKSDVSCWKAHNNGQHDLCFLEDECQIIKDEDWTVSSVTYQFYLWIYWNLDTDPQHLQVASICQDYSAVRGGVQQMSWLEDNLTETVADWILTEPLNFLFLLMRISASLINIISISKNSQHKYVSNKSRFRCPWRLSSF